MDGMMMQKISAARVKKKFGSHKVLYSKYTPQIPASAERENLRCLYAHSEDRIEKRTAKAEKGV